MIMKYDVILSDPPWKYNARANRRTRFRSGAYGHYPLMSTDDIAALPVPGIAAENAVLFLWATFPMLEDALRVIQAWGFRYSTIGFLWVKLNPGRVHWSKQQLVEQLYSKGPVAFLDWLRFFGVGYYAKSNTEPCPLATRGRVLKPAVNTVSSVVFAPRGEHSAKPHEVHRRIEQMYPLDDYRHLELFATAPRAGWRCLGNEMDSQDIQTSLSTLSIEPMSPNLHWS